MFATMLLSGVLSMSAMAVATAKMEEARIERFGLYVRVSDLRRAKAFYMRVFAKEPYVANDKLVGFDVAGGLFALYLDSVEMPRQGNSTVPYIKVSDATLELQRIKSIASASVLDDKVIFDGPLALFRFKDPDGNLIEFFSLTQNQ